MFLKKREQLIRRCLAQVTNFVGQFRMFQGKFTYDGQHLRDFLTELLERVHALTGMGDAVQGGHISAMSSHVDDRASNARNVRSLKAKSRGSVRRSSVLKNLDTERKKLISAGADHDNPYLQNAFALEDDGVLSASMDLSVRKRVKSQPESVRGSATEGVKKEGVESTVQPLVVQPSEVVKGS